MKKTTLALIAGTILMAGGYPPISINAKSNNTYKDTINIKSNTSTLATEEASIHGCPIRDCKMLCYKF